MKTDLIETDFIIGALYAIVRGEGYHLLVYGGGETWYNGTRSDTPWGARPKSGDRVVKIDMEVPLENCGCAELERDIAKVFSITYGPEPKPFSPLPSIQMVQRTLGLPIGSKVEMPSPELIAGMTALAIFKAKLDHKPGATWSDGIRKMLAIPEARENILNPPSLELEVEKYREIKGPGVAKTTALIPQEYTLFRTTLGISERTGFELVLPVQVTPRGALVVFRAKENPLPVSIHGLWVIPPEAALRLCQKPSIETSDLPVVLQGRLSRCILTGFTQYKRALPELTQRREYWSSRARTSLRTNPMSTEEALRTLHIEELWSQVRPLDRCSFLAGTRDAGSLHALMTGDLNGPVPAHRAALTLAPLIGLS